MWIWGGRSAQLLPACSLWHSAFPWHSPAAMEGSACVPLCVPSPAVPFLVSIQVSSGLFQPLGLEQRDLRWQSLTDCGKLGLAEGCVVQLVSRGPGKPKDWLPAASGSPVPWLGCRSPECPKQCHQLHSCTLVALLSCAHWLGS